MGKSTYKKSAQRVTRPSEGKQIQRQTFEVKQTSWQGHLPAEEMARYEAIEPGFANRLLIPN